jgi:hypothetical protein
LVKVPAANVPSTSQQPTINIVPTEVPNIPSKPEDIIDARLLPAWELLANSNDPEVHWLSPIILNYHIKIFIVPQLNNDEWSEFTYTCTTNPQKYAGDGAIEISEKLLNEADPVVVASALVHETIHAQQLITDSKSCDCTVESEYEAHSAQIRFLIISGRSDLAEKYFGSDIVYASGYFDKNKLWQTIERTYPKCFNSGNPYDTIVMSSPIPLPQYKATSTPYEDLNAPGARYMIDEYGHRVPYVEGKGTLQVAGYYQAPNGKWYPVGPPSIPSTPQPERVQGCPFQTNDLCEKWITEHPGNNN